ncbi:MAG TPA: TIM barrel protein [Vicinamibacterales bacterium]|nr:TIM barrel protein [Vicinamibacterales bacterium]
MRTDRRTFVRSALAAGAAAAAWPLPGLPVSSVGHASARQARRFKLAYAPHFGMFRQHAGQDLVAELEFMAAEGFTALEDNGLRERPVEVQEQIGRTLARLNMRMGVFVGHAINWTEATLTSSDVARRDGFVEQIRASVDVARRVGATWMTVVPGHVDRRPHLDYQTANVVEALKRAAAVLEPHGVVMVLEPLNTLRNHPGMFLTTTPQAYLICKAVASPSCKILYDVYHQQITEGNLLPNIDAAWDEIAYFQVGDNPGRNEPGTGEINYRNVFRHIHGKGYAGIVGMEHGNSQRGREGERAVIEAYVAADGF